MNVRDIVFEGLAYTVMGLLVVFLILIIIMLVIKAMEFFSKTEEDKPQEAAKPEPQPAVVAEDAAEPSDETELIAVITAAVAAAMKTNPSGLFIKSYKKVSGGAWNEAGRREALDNRF